MDRFVARQNIEHLRRRLGQARDPALIDHLGGLLDEAYAQLERAEAAHRDPARSADLAAIHASAPAERGDGSDDAVGATRVAALVKQLERETDPLRRLGLRRRLIEEADRFGRLAQRLDLADRHIEDGARNIVALESRLSDPGCDEDVRRRNVAILANSREILAVLRSYRASLADRADGRGV